MMIVYFRVAYKIFTYLTIDAFLYRFHCAFFIIFSVLTLKLLPIIFSGRLSNLLSFSFGVFVNLSCVKELYFILG